LVGSKDFIARARRNRKMVGGGMRQAGIIAAAGIVALETMIDRLAEDHANAKYFAENLADLPGISLDPARVKTNIVFYELTNGVTAEEMQVRLEKRGVLIFATGQSRMRAVTHYGITRADIENTLDVFAKVLRENK
ncbi:MAG TPA: beta-eliminating lyase-related protein, partial [Anaerolineae bacterium]